MVWIILAAFVAAVCAVVALRRTRRPHQQPACPSCGYAFNRTPDGPVRCVPDENWSHYDRRGYLGKIVVAHVDWEAEVTT